MEWAGSQRTEGNLLKQRMTQELKAFVQNLPKVCIQICVNKDNTMMIIVIFISMGYCR